MRGVAITFAFVLLISYAEAEIVTQTVGGYITELYSSIAAALQSVNR